MLPYFGYQYNIQILLNYLFKYRTKQIKTTETNKVTNKKATISIKICNYLICFCSFDLSCYIPEIDIFIKYMYIVLSCLIK